MAFHYSYDAAGNVLAYTRVMDGVSSETSYTYDDANQLLTATEGETTWYYTYDNNGSLVMSSPSQGEANGATRNTYNKAGYLVKVEEHNGTAWQTQSEMRYDGLGNRLEMTSYNEGVGETIRYQLDNGQPLAAVGTESTSFYLYGRGVIGTKTDNWAYILQDGLGSTRQLATHEGVIAMSVAYTPWGDVLAYYGSGGIDFGYLGGMYDDATGLIYLGSGQYYDPVTGRMLTRGAGQGNPYKPGAYDPAGMMVAPLAMLGLVLGKKKKRGKWDSFIALLVVCVVVGMSLSACGPKASAPTPPPESPPANASSPGDKTVDGRLPETEETATPTPSEDCHGIPEPTTTPVPAKTSGYYIPTESQARNAYGGIDIPIPALQTVTDAPYLVRADLRTKKMQFSWNWFEAPAQYANEVLLYDHNYTCLQGSAQLDNGEYITCQNPESLWWDGFAPEGDPIRDKVSFLWADMTLINKLVPFKTVAVCNSSSISGTIQLRGLEGHPILIENGNPDAIFDVKDTGQGLCPEYSPDEGLHIDIFTGIGLKAYNATLEFFGRDVEVYTIDSAN